MRHSENDLQASDESQISEIELLPDGRVCLFGATTQLLQFLEELGLGDARLHQRLLQIESNQATTSAIEVAEADVQRNFDESIS